MNIDEARAFLEELVREDRTDWPHDGLCVFCGAYREHGMNREEHDPGCLWRRVKEAL